MGGLVEHVTGRNRTTTTARLILFMKAHEPSLREAVSRGRTTMQAAVEGALAG